MHKPAPSLEATSSPTFNEQLDAHHLAPLWEVLHGLITPTPVTPVHPACWRYEEVRKLVLASGAHISAEQAERRVLVLENPGMRGQSSATRSLYAGVQLVLPGEVARAHRHTQAALRFVIEGQGGYTVVEGERLPMAPGDLVLTPSWTWHDHGNDGQEPMIWLDGLDVQLVNLLDAGFAEPGATARQDVHRENQQGVGREACLTALDERDEPPRHFPFAETQRALADAVARGLDPWHGARMRYRDPTSGDWPMPTMGPFAQFVPKGFKTRGYRSTDSGIFLVHEGKGRAVIGDERFAFGPKDIFVVPSWARREINADDDLTLLAFSDRPAQEKLGVWREMRDPV